MRRTRILAIAAGAVVLVVLAGVLIERRGATAERTAGSPFLPGLEARADEIAAVEVQRGNATVRLERRDGGGWALASSDGYPARGELVRAMLVSLAGLKVEDRMTARKERHDELGLAWPDPSGRARLVRFLGKGPAAVTVAEAVVGEERFTPDAVFVRLPAQDQTWRARGRVQVPADAMAWLDRTLLSLPAGETVEARLDGIVLRAPEQPADAEAAAAPRAPWSVRVEDAEEAHWSEAQRESARTGLPSFLERLELEGVRRARTDVAKEPRWSPYFETRSATVVLRGHREADGTWFTVDVAPKPGAAAPAKPARDGDPFVPDWQQLAAALAGWEFRMPQWKADTLARMRAPAGAEAPADAAGDGAGDAPPIPLR